VTSWKTNVGTQSRMQRNCRKSTKQRDAVCCTRVRIVRSWSMKTPRSRTIEDDAIIVEPIKEPQVGSRCGLRAGVNKNGHMTAITFPPRVLNHACGTSRCNSSVTKFELSSLIHSKKGKATQSLLNCVV